MKLYIIRLILLFPFLLLASCITNHQIINDYYGYNNGVSYRLTINDSFAIFDQNMYGANLHIIDSNYWKRSKKRISIDSICLIQNGADTLRTDINFLYNTILR